MNISSITDMATRVGGRYMLKAQKHSPEILVVGGVVGLLAAGVMAARATTHLEPAVARLEDGLDTVEQMTTPHNVPGYSDEDKRKDLAKIYLNFAWDMTKLYGPAVTVAAASATAVLGGHKILHGRHVALIGAYQGLQFTFDEYRKRTEDAIGADKEREIYQGLIKEKVKDEETGKTKTIKKQSPHGMSQYARFFDDFNVNYVSGRPDLNKLFLLSQETYLNNKLRAQGHLFLNEVYDALGMERTPAGSQVGWVYGSEVGDGYVSFGLDDSSNEMMRMFVNGLEDAVLIDFNVDGVMWNLI